MKATLSLFILLAAMACEKADPFVDRVEAPVLVIFQNANGSFSNGLTTEPTISSPAAADAKITVKLLELDKTNLLDNKKGIDSIGVSALPVTIKLRNGTKISDASTDASGKLVLTTTWKSLGIENPTSGTPSVLLSLSSSYKSVSFTKFFRLTASK